MKRKLSRLMLLSLMILAPLSVLACTQRELPAATPKPVTISIPTATPTPIPTPTPIVTDISTSNQPIIDKALGKFNPGIRDYLASVPIIYGDARTARAQTTAYEPPGKEHIVVNYDWDGTYGKSKYWDSHYKKRGYDPNDPTFSETFKLRLLVHEYLHHIELKINIDREKFFEDVDKWYKDLQWGSHLHDDIDTNYVKATLFHNIYGGNRSKYGYDHPGVEEFAYIGQNISLGGKARLAELPPNIIEYYRGILREDLLVIEESPGQ